MKKIIVVLLIGCITIASFLLFSKKDVSISFEKNKYNNTDLFDALDVTIKNYSDNMTVEVEGLDLLGFSNEEISNKKGYIKEFGIFTLEYKIYFKDELVCFEYREIINNVYQSNSNNIILNNDFNANIYNWKLTGESYFNYSIDNKLIIDQTSISEFWEQSLYQNIELEYNEKYQISFVVETTSKKQIELSIHQSLSFEPWSYNFGLLEYVEIEGETLVEFEFTFINPNTQYSDVNDVRLEIKFGNNDYLNHNITTFSFSNFELIKI